MRYYSGSGLITLDITKAEAESCSHPGPCDDDVERLRLSKRIARQVAKLDPEHVRQELADYGAWGDEELSNHEDNLKRLLWIACCDITEEEK